MFSIKMDTTSFNQTPENCKFLRIFQILGFLPFRLKSNDGNFAKYTSIGLFVLIVSLTFVRCFVPHNKIELVFLFAWDIATILLDIISTYFLRKRYEKLFTLISEIDEIFWKKLYMKEELEARNSKFHKKLLIVWIMYCILNFYYPFKELLENDFSTFFYDSLFRIISW